MLFKRAWSVEAAVLFKREARYSPEVEDRLAIPDHNGVPVPLIVWRQGTAVVCVCR
jgi:hypothetical protein